MSRFRVEVEPSGAVRVFASPSELDRIAGHLAGSGLACRRDAESVAVDAGWRETMAALARYDGESPAAALPAETASSAETPPPGLAAETAAAPPAAPVPWLQVFLWTAGFAALIGAGFVLLRLVEELTGNERVAKWFVVGAALLGSMVYKLLSRLFRSRAAAEPAEGSGGTP